MRHRLAVFWSWEGYVVAWLDGDGDEGLRLGDTMPKSAPARDRAEHDAATKAARMIGERRPGRSLLWYTRGDAEKAVKAARAAVRVMGKEDETIPGRLRARASDWRRKANAASERGRTDLFDEYTARARECEAIAKALKEGKLG